MPSFLTRILIVNYLIFSFLFHAKIFRTKQIFAAESGKNVALTQLLRDKFLTFLTVIHSDRKKNSQEKLISVVLKRNKALK